jgi:hypothetical protein
VANNRLVALGLKNQRNLMPKSSNPDRKEFISPKPVGNEISRQHAELSKNVSPMLLPHMPNISINMMDNSEDQN